MTTTDFDEKKLPVSLNKTTGKFITTEDIKKSKEHEALLSLEQLDELDCIRMYDSAKNSDDDIIPYEQAIIEIENNR